MTRVLCAALCLVVALILAPSGPAFAQRSVTVESSGGDVTVLADRIEQLGADNLVIAIGNVEVTRGSARLIADRVELNRDTGDVVASGRVIFYDGTDQLTGERIDYNYKTGTGVVRNGRGRTAPYYRIGGEQMELLGEGLYRIRRGIFTTCEDDPPTWSFRAGTANVNSEEGVYGTNASFWVKQLPVIPFFPFFAAAIRRERQTGFLFPRYGSSSRKGYFAEVPFFWAISDSQDATITLDGYEKRGVGAHLEYRYILASTNRGVFSGFFIHETTRFDDNLAIGPETRDVHQNRAADRGWGSLRHDWVITRGLLLKVDVNGVSDDNVFREYGDRLHHRSLQRVESTVSLSQRWDTWNLVGKLFGYQDLTQRRPVELYRLPEITLDASRQPLFGESGLLYDVESSVANFVRDVGSEGRRVDVHPRFSRPISAAGFFTVTPFVGGRLTAYDRTVTGSRVTGNGGITVETTEDRWRLRRLIEIGTDVETRASRVYPLNGLGGVDAVLHSIEPRATYALISGQGSDRLPNWTGIDRIEETSAIRYSLTNRVRARTVAPPGTEPLRWEAARFVVSQSYDFNRIGKDARPLSDVTADLIVTPGRYVTARAETTYNVYGEGFQTTTFDLGVVAPPVFATVGTRFDRPNDIEFLQGTLRADISRYATAHFTTNWDLRSNTFIENRLALDIKFQCWGFTLEYTGRHRDEDAIRFSINLLGVGAPLSTGFGVGGGAPAGSTTSQLPR